MSKLIKEPKKPINCKLIFGPSKPFKITKNDKGIWRRIKGILPNGKVDG